ncbi:hypothetical protein Tco_1079509 [Tanacetum coccineum]|uniref:Uncharacterized protein n=1 Tax=Tanacetum coccineum TaxID=301880 RepID=A0ABQ5HSY1_9ASTR
MPLDSHLDITSDHKPGSASRTSITPDFVHAGGSLLHLSNLHRSICHKGYVLFEDLYLAGWGALRYLSNWRLNDLLSLSFTATLDGTRTEVCSDCLRFQLIPLSSSTLLLSLERSTSMVLLICRLSSHMVSLRTKAFVPALLRCSACNLIMNIPKWICWRPEYFYCLNKVLLLGQGLLAFLLIVLAVFLGLQLTLGTSVEDVWPSRTHFFGSFSNCSLKILLGSSKTCIFPSVLFTGSLPLIEKLSSLLAKLDSLQGQQAESPSQ